MTWLVAYLSAARTTSRGEVREAPDATAARCSGRPRVSRARAIAIPPVLAQTSEYAPLRPPGRPVVRRDFDDLRRRVCVESAIGAVATAISSGSVSRQRDEDDDMEPSAVD